MISEAFYFSKLLSLAENFIKVFTAMGGKFKFSAQERDAQERDLEYFFWKSKNLSVSSEIIPSLIAP